MVFSNPLIVVNDLKKAKKFYHDILGLEVILDFGENVTLTGGIALQTKSSWLTFINKDKNEISFGANDAELYFVEDDFSRFVEHLKNFNIKYVHPPIEHRWGQRVVRFYDVDNHIIEVGENMGEVCKRFMESGMTLDETAKRMDVPCSFVASYVKG